MLLHNNLHHHGAWCQSDGLEQVGESKIPALVAGQQMMILRSEV